MYRTIYHISLSSFASLDKEPNFRHTCCLLRILNSLRGREFRFHRGLRWSASIFKPPGHCVTEVTFRAQSPSGRKKVLKASWGFKSIFENCGCRSARGNLFSWESSLSLYIYIYDTCIVVIVIVMIFSIEENSVTQAMSLSIITFLGFGHGTFEHTS